MHHFRYHEGALHCEQLNLHALAEEYGTPLYVYSAQSLRDQYQRLERAFAPVQPQIHYAVKANSNLSILRLLGELGAHFDIVSAGELYRVLQAGGSAQSVSFAGVGKTASEIRYALKEGIHSFVCESWQELVAINHHAGELGLSAPVAVRVNPNVDAKTHKYISTGKSENKFGIDFEDIASIYERMESALPALRPRGIQMHIGSQLTDAKPFVEALEKVLPLATELTQRYGLEFFSIGGGLGVVYDPALASGSPEWWQQQGENAPLSIEAYAKALLPLLQTAPMNIHMEPGRVIAANAGVLLTEILYTKTGKQRTFQICDAGMGELIRPALYQGYHEVVPLREPETPPSEFTKTDVVGPICESADFFVQNHPLPPLEQGDLLALMSAGAYGFTMASNYNTRPLPAEVLVDGNKARLIRRAQHPADLIAQELDYLETGA